MTITLNSKSPNFEKTVLLQYNKNETEKSISETNQQL